MTDIKKPLKDEALVGKSSNNGSSNISGLKARIERYDTAKSNQTKILNYLRFNSNKYPNNIQTRLDKLKNDVGGCGNYLVFKNYYTVDTVRLRKASFCKKHFLCQLCAIRRGAKQVQAYMRKLETIQAENPTLKPFLLTYTVKNGENIKERFEHLRSSLKKLMIKRRDYLAKDVFSEFGQAFGGVYSIEFTKSKSGWHPHVHMVVLLEPDHQIDFPYLEKPKNHPEWESLTPKQKAIEKQISKKAWQAYGEKAKASGLSKEWYKITKDSFIVDLRPIEGDPAQGFVEVFKYALKFSDLSPEDNVNAYLELLNARGCLPHFTGAFGKFQGVEESDNLLDEPLDDLPYIELFYKYTKDGYSLATAIKKKSDNEQKQDIDNSSPLDEVNGEPLRAQSVKKTNIGFLIAKEKYRLQCNRDLDAGNLIDDIKRKNNVVFDDSGNMIDLDLAVTFEPMKIEDRIELAVLEWELQCNSDKKDCIIN